MSDSSRLLRLYAGEQVEGSRVDAITTLRGDDNTDPYSSFNCCDYVGDDPEHVASCRRALCQELGIPSDHLVTLRQVHSCRVVDALEVKGRVEADALVCDTPGIYIGIFTADCVPILLFDRRQGVIAAVHAGWRGTLSRILTPTIDMMLAKGALMADIEVIFGPAICRDCYEVGMELIEEFGAADFPMERIATIDTAKGKGHLDLVEANISILEEIGVSSKRITRSNLCTLCNPGRFFSARRLGINSGRILTAIAINP